MRYSEKMFECCSTGWEKDNKFDLIFIYSLSNVASANKNFLVFFPSNYLLANTIVYSILYITSDITCHSVFANIMEIYYNKNTHQRGFYFIFPFVQIQTKNYLAYYEETKKKKIRISFILDFLIYTLYIEVPYTACDR